MNFQLISNWIGKLKIYIKLLCRVLFLFVPLFITYFDSFIQDNYSLVYSHKLTWGLLVVVLSYLFLRLYIFNAAWLLQVNRKIIYWKNTQKFDNLVKQSFCVNMNSIEMPIYTNRFDLLDIFGEVVQFFNNYVEKLFHPRQNSVILLDGEFGIGKSSFINLLNEYIQNSFLSQHRFLCRDDISVIKISALKFISLDKSESDDTKLRDFANYINNQLLSTERKFFSNFLNSLEETSVKLGGIEFKLVNFIQSEKSLDKFSLNKYLLIIEDMDRLGDRDLRILIRILFLIHDMPNIVTILPLSKDMLLKATRDEFNVTLKMINVTTELPKAVMAASLARNIIQHPILKSYISEYFASNSIINAYNPELCNKLEGILIRFLQSIIGVIIYKFDIAYRDIKALDYTSIVQQLKSLKSLFVFDSFIDALSHKYSNLEDLKFERHLSWMNEDNNNDLLYECYYKLFEDVLPWLQSAQIEKYNFFEKSGKWHSDKLNKYVLYLFTKLLFNDSSKFSRVFGSNRINNIFNWIDEDRVSFEWFKNEDLIKLSILFFPVISSIEPQKQNVGFSIKIIQSLYMVFALSLAKCLFSNMDHKFMNFRKNGLIINYINYNTKSLDSYIGNFPIDFSELPIILKLDDDIEVDLRQSFIDIRSKVITFLDDDKVTVNKIYDRIREILRSEPILVEELEMLQVITKKES